MVARLSADCCSLKSLLNSYFMSFFFLAKEKGRKRTAPACRARLGAGRPLGAEPVFPRITSRETTSVIALRPLGAIQNNVAGRISTEKPSTQPPVAPGAKCTIVRETPFLHTPVERRILFTTRNLHPHPSTSGCRWRLVDRIHPEDYQSRARGSVQQRTRISAFGV